MSTTDGQGHPSLDTRHPGQPQLPPSVPHPAIQPHRSASCFWKLRSVFSCLYFCVSSASTCHLQGLNAIPFPGKCCFHKEACPISHLPESISGLFLPRPECSSPAEVSTFLLMLGGGLFSVGLQLLDYRTYVCSSFRQHFPAQYNTAAAQSPVLRLTVSVGLSNE